MYILPFTSNDATLANAGGKGANLVRLTRAGFNVPRGFIISTGAYQSFVSTNQLQPLIQETLKRLSANDPARLEETSADIREAFSRSVFPEQVEAEIIENYAMLGGTPVAVRSSATAEDLPELSFAGQQDTYLNILDAGHLRAAVIDCWSSLWTARAIGYRLRNDIPHEQTALAVVVQEMVASAVSGVLFTANPLSGRLDESVIDATFGLGEALVSGQVEPDHFIASSLSGAVLNVTLGAKQVATRGKSAGGVETTSEDSSGIQTLDATQLRDLVHTGQAIQKEYGSPQDIEWAVDARGEQYILQARPITSLFPVPEMSFDPLIAWFSFGAIQGLVGPMTPIGLDAIKHVVASARGMVGLEPDFEHFNLMVSSGERLWIRISDMVRNPLGSRLFKGFVNFAEPSIGQILVPLTADPRIGAGQGKMKFSTIRRLFFFALPILARLAHNIMRPASARASLERLIDSRLSGASIPSAADRFGRLAAAVAFVQEHVATTVGYLLPRFIPIFGPSMAGLTLLTHLSGDPALVLEVTRGLPDNVTTEMDLQLWKTAEAISKDAEAAKYFRAGNPPGLAGEYLAGTLPATTQAAIAGFMGRYGMRGVGEIDFGQPRWREDPTPVMHTLQSYLNTDESHSPLKMFALGEKAGVDAVERIAQKIRAEPGGWLKEKVARAAARRIRLLMSARESPKFFIIRIMGIGRQALLEVGREFAQAGTINAPSDLFYLTLAELDLMSRQGQPDGGWIVLIAARRANFQRELRRKQVPRVLTSDGRAFYEGLGAETDTGTSITGSPVSPGVAEGSVHVMLDPRQAQLVPGEILVCPGTDPAWTPLFMVAGGLITEVGGMMTHGSVVAREYGIPAVVGVHEATTRLKDGQRIRVDGTSGKIIIL